MRITPTLTKMNAINKLDWTITMPKRGCRWIKVFGLSLLIACSARAATFTSSGSLSDIQAKINSAAVGDTVTLPAGTYSWSGGITINRPVTLQGAGSGSTRIAGNQMVTVNSTGTGTVRLTGLTFDGGTGQVILVEVSGNSPVLIDQCAFIGGNASEMIHNLGMGAGSTAGWANNVVPGSANALYIEDCTFTKNPISDQYFWGTSAIESYYGACTVMRYCTLNYCQIDQHGTQGMIGARWWEFYNNTFVVPSGGNQSNYFALRGGSGVVFNNHMSGGPNVGGGGIEIYDENGDSSPLYVCRGINQSPSPVYVWGNDSSMPVQSGSSNVVLNRDYYVSATQPAAMLKWQLTTDSRSTSYAYKPYTYPHPMRLGANPTTSPGVPMAPSNLRVSQSR
jgi:hypothetical protein